MSFNSVMNTMLPPTDGKSPHITGNYGENRGTRGPHGGTDFNYEGGQTGINLENPTIGSPVDGVVTFSGGAYGTIKIRDADGNSHEILHASSRSVTVGQTVSAGEAIGTMGGMGPSGAGSYAKHIHYQMKDAQGHRINPQEFWNGRRDATQAAEAAKKDLDAAKKAMSPIILDLDGDGVKTLALSEGAHFDFDGNGFAEQTGWVGAGDALLVRDMDGNGSIDSGAELFGDQTVLAGGAKAANGFEALADLDSNHDNKFDAADAAFSSLQVWQDFDGDGFVSDGELFALQDVGVQSINVGYVASDLVDEAGNAHAQIGSYTTTDGEHRAAEDVWFQTDATFSVATTLLDLPAEVQPLPDLQGFGNIYDLRQAVVRDQSGALTALLSQFSLATSPTERTAILEQLLFKWTGADAYTAESRGPNVDGRQLYALEALMGDKFSQASSVSEDGTSPNPAPVAAESVNAAYQTMLESYYAQLMAQTTFKELYDAVEYSWGDGSQAHTADLSAVAGKIGALIGSDRPQGIDVLEDFIRTLRGMGMVDMSNAAQFRKALLPLGDDVALVLDSGFFGNIGTDGNDTLVGALRTNLLNGLKGDDALRGGTGGDTLVGGAGNDLMEGGEGDDLYLVNDGDGVDSIGDYDFTSGNTDTLRFGPGIAPDDVVLTRDDNNLYLSYGESGGRVAIQNWFGASGKIERIAFTDDPTVWDVAQTESRITVASATDGNDILYGTSANDVIAGVAGNDMLSGQLGDDTLTGGGGDDTLNGGAGNDVFLFGRGAGNDTIIENNTSSAHTNTVRLAADVHPDDIVVSRDLSNLYISISGTTDRLTFKDFASSTARKNKEVAFSDGSGVVWDLATLLAKSGATNGDDFVVGTTGGDTLAGMNGNDTIYGMAGNDTFDGGQGDDALHGGYMADLYLYARGDGVDVINEANGVDTIRFGAGINPDEVLVARDALSLQFYFAGSGDKVTIKNHFTNAAYQIERVEFADGTVWTQTDWTRKALQPTANDDYLMGTADNDFITGLDGNDNLFGSTGNDSLDGGAGNDLLVGGAGNDVYIFGTGDGQDIVFDNDTGIANSDSVKLLDGISPDQVSLGREGADLTLTVSGMSDKMTIQGWFAAGATRVELLSFADGTIWNLAERLAHVDGTEESDLLLDISGNGALQGLAGNDSLYGFGGADVLSGGAGADQLHGGDGDDTLVGGSGDDLLLGGNGHDVYRFGAGSGQDRIEFTAGGSGSGGVEFGAGIRADSVAMQRTGVDLLIHIGPNDSLTVANFFTGAEPGLTQIKFSEDGIVWDRTAIENGSQEGNVALGYGTDSADVLAGTNGIDAMYGLMGNDTLRGLGGQDTLNGGLGNDVLDGGAGADLLAGGSGDDAYIVDDADDMVVELAAGGEDQVFAGVSYALTENVENLSLLGSAVAAHGNALDNEIIGTSADNQITGGAGADTLDGGGGNDLFIFGRGDGTDVILRNSVDNGYSVLRFNADIAPEDVIVSGDDPNQIEGQNNLYLTIGDYDRVTLSHWLDADGVGAISQVEFADGTVWDAARLLSEAAAHPLGTTRATEFDDFLVGDDRRDIFVGLGGNDTIQGMGSDDYLDGSAGNDLLRGGAGNDEYMYLRGTGLDMIDDQGAGDDVDILNFGQGIAAADIATSRVGNSLVLGVNGSAEGVVLKDWFIGGANGIRSVNFDNLDGWDARQLRDHYTVATELSGTAADDALEGYGGGDTLAGGAGNDLLQGGAGGDTYLFNLGDGVDTIADHGSDVASPDKVLFGEGISTTAVVVTRDMNDLHLSIGDDRLVLNNWFRGDEDKIEQIEFATGQVWTRAELEAMIPVAPPTGVELIGTEGDDYLYGGDGNDTLTGGRGNDGLIGGSGNDVYRFTRGDGQDAIWDYGVAGDADRIEWGDGVAATDVSVTMEWQDMVLRVAGSDDAVTLGDWTSADARIEQVAFADGTVWSAADLVARLAPATSGDDTLVALPSGSEVAGLAGGDILIGLDGNDALSGGDGSDEVSGGAGEDTLVGGTGNDYLVGGAGGDRYIFTSGDGQDIILDFRNAETTETDTLRITGSNPSDILVSRDNGNLYLSIFGSNDRVSFNEWFMDDSAQAKRVVFDNGVIWNRDDLMAKLGPVELGSNDDVAYGGDSNDVFVGGAGNDILTGVGGDDLLDGGADDDQIWGGLGNDVLIGGAGNDVLNEVSGANVLDGGAGNDYLYGADGNEIFAGGQGDDFINIGMGYDIVAFNQGDGHDTIATQGEAHATLSLGGGIAAADLLFERQGNNLRLLTGGGETIDFGDWYHADFNGKNVDTLQLIGDAGADYNPDSTDPLNNKKVLSFDFQGLVAAFDSAQATTPGLDTWSLASSLLNFHIGSSDTESIGGDLSYRYAHDSTFDGVLLSTKQTVLADERFGQTSQLLS